MIRKRVGDGVCVGVVVNRVALWNWAGLGFWILGLRLGTGFRFGGVLSDNDMMKVLGYS
jgi:hypothetical protein